MYLTRGEEEALEGERGPGRRKAMELLLALGKIYDADRLIPIESAHLSGVSYKTIGEGGLAFLTDMAEDANVTVKTTLNPAGMDLERWREMGVGEEFASKQRAIVESYARMGVDTCCTCTPYLHCNVPAKGDTIAWAESNALSYANSVLGARTNREGGPGALAAAIMGRTPSYGLHLDENRVPSAVVEVDIDDDITSHSMIGHAVGKMLGGGIPYFRGIHPSTDSLKTLAGAMAASGAVPMFHIEGVTPEASRQELDGLERIQLGRVEVEEAMESLTTGSEPDLIALGCPHLSIQEVRSLASFLEGRRKRTDTEIWFCTSRQVRSACPKEVKVLERFGKVACDTCMVVAPIEDRYSCTATNSGKACAYLPGLGRQRVLCGRAERLLEMVL
ncbi:MAG: aconitase X catalytic domain-containing protein [Methanomassiliicoccales archaeon]